MKIALVSLHFSEYASHLAQALSESGHKVLLLLDSENAKAELGTYPILSDIEAVIIQRRQLKDPRSILFNVPKIVTAIIKFRPDIIHVQETFHDYLFLALPALQAFPLIMTVHDPVPHSGQDSNIGLRRAFYRSGLRRVIRHVIVHGDSLRQAYLTTSAGKKAKISVIPHGILGSGVSLSAKPSKGDSFLFFGRMEAYKGLGVFLDALDLLDSRGIRYRAVIAGRGNDLERYRDRIHANAAIQLRDEFIRVEDIPDLFLGSKAIILPYLDGTQSGVAAMAFGYGRPVIATRVGSLPEMVQSGRTGLLVPPDDSNALASAMEELINDKNLLARLEAGVKEAAKHEFSWSTIAGMTELAYQGAIHGNHE